MKFNCTHCGKEIELEVVQPTAKVIEPKQDKPAYKAGDKVKIIARTCAHEQNVGDVVTLLRTYCAPAFSTETCWIINNHENYVRESDIEPYTEPQDKPPTQYREVKRVAKEGEWVKILSGAIVTNGKKPGDVFECDGKDERPDSSGFIWGCGAGRSEYVVLEPIVFDWDAFRSGQIAVHCDTEEKAKAFFAEIKSHPEISDTWDGASVWHIYDKNTCYDAQRNGADIHYSPVEWYKSAGCTILNYPDLTPYVEPDSLADYEWVEGYKGFNADLTCKGFQYEIGKEYDLGEKEKMCDKGFHFCKTLDDVHKFYADNGGNRFCKVSGLVKKGFAYSDKYCARKIKIGEECTKPKYWSGKAVCIEYDARCGNSFTVGKVYEFKNGVVVDNEGDKYNSPILDLSETQSQGWVPHFIEFKG